MAETILQYNITYENGVEFKVQRQLNSGGWETIIEADEQGHIADTWTFMQQITEKNFSLDMDVIGAIMKS